jgi:hypothetical protein
VPSDIDEWIEAMIMGALFALFAILLAVVSASEGNVQHRIKSVSGLSEGEAGKLVDRVWKGNAERYISVPIYDYESACVMVADMDGDSREEVIVAITVAWKADGFIAILRKEQEDYRLLSQINCDGSPEGLRAMDLSGDGKQALIVEPLTARAAKWKRESVQVYRWDEGKLVNIWEGATSEDGFSMDYKYKSDAKVQFMDLNGDGMQEIIRSGVVYKAEWEKQPGLKGVRLPEIEKMLFPEQLKRDEPAMDFAGIRSGYEAIYKFRQTFFYDEDFRHYIQYKARVTRNTNSVAAGTRVGVMGTLSEAYISLLSLAPIFVVLPDSRVIQLPDRSILERIYEADR